ncbi:hypothetical protein, unlikely [Trypanosoma brucei gambiense DAL972]|uniref:Uncharacterized protein n=1 Tax=Trypanosoma brucei gambiense (strain MHOM/CI/86/DAL972) TaxID=679716 RepID=C9ZT17_TRYB9|nr:hypothetical protein, unlikely [Trypanosoma brucei gambiense DAL972]CBH12552.1 hypothetical protein, unlikely [Trypanosoma brucei gambiense DAL972]|eukprot:XP_011774832.1 hypothetical protein, unlikely [Trypanosoma brucei gambiense DAL972]
MRNFHLVKLFCMFVLNCRPPFFLLLFSSFCFCFCFSCCFMFKYFYGLRVITKRKRKTEWIAVVSLHTSFSYYCLTFLISLPFFLFFFTGVHQ